MLLVSSIHPCHQRMNIRTFRLAQQHTSQQTYSAFQKQLTHNQFIINYLLKQDLLRQMILGRGSHNMLAVLHAPVLQSLDHTPQCFRIRQRSVGDCNRVTVFNRPFDQSIFFQVF